MAELKVGAFSTKVPLVSSLEKHKLALAMVAVTHRKGGEKYPPFSWYNTPETGDSTVPNNIDASLRHLIAYSMGFAMDPDGLPHTFHLCCRTAMMFTILDKVFSHVTKIVADADAVRKINQLPSTWWAHISSALITSIGRIDSIPNDRMLISTDIDTYIPIIRGSLQCVYTYYNKLVAGKIKTDDIVVNLSHPGISLLNTVFSFAEADWKKNKKLYLAHEPFVKNIQDFEDIFK